MFNENIKKVTARSLIAILPKPILITEYSEKVQHFSCYILRFIALLWVILSTYHCWFPLPMSLQEVLKNLPTYETYFCKHAISLLVLNYHFIGTGLKFDRNNSEQNSWTLLFQN